MPSEPPSLVIGVGALFNAFERLVLFALSLAVGVLNLLIGIVIAAHMGVLPKSAAARVLGATSRATAYVSRIMEAPPTHGAAPKRKARR
ncbi:MAG TPA: hypothetical protein VH309_09095 [Elusimicrobiota bacterium]|jgi:hypothetical protein|nr:hypothetical protein [Elusimicrobiota bacterium]